MNKPSLGLLSLLLPLYAFANVSEWKNGQFEAGAIYGRGDSRMGNMDSYGGYVSGGYYFGNHLVQLEVAGLTSEDLGGYSIMNITNPFNTAQKADYMLKKADIQEYPIWVRYSYGISFGPGDRIRLEAGPLLGIRIISYSTNYDATVHQTGQPDQIYKNLNDRSGGVVFDYGLSAGLKMRLADHWSLSLGYRYVRTTSFELKPEIAPFGSTTATAQQYVVLPLNYPEHGTHYATLGVEYRF